METEGHISTFYAIMNEKILHIFSLEGKAAVITGTSRGNGRAIAQSYADAGAIVYGIQRVGGVKDARIKFLEVDVTDKKAVGAAITQIVKEVGHIDILVNNAGISVGSQSSEKYSEEDWDKTYETNLKAIFLLSQQVARVMIKQKSGVIINITSINAEQGFPNNPAYVAFKGGLKQLTKAFAYDLGKYNIRVNNLGLGYFKTDMTKKSWDDPKLRRARANHTLLGRWGDADDLIGPAIFLASDASRYITGIDLYVDGGWLAKGI